MPEQKSIKEQLNVFLSPWLPYDKLSPAIFGRVFLLFQLLELQTYYMIVNRSSGIVRRPATWKEISATIRKLSDDDFNLLWRVADRKLAAYLLGHRVQHLYLENELTRRMGNNPVAVRFNLFEIGDISEEDFARTLQSKAARFRQRRGGLKLHDEDERQQTFIKALDFKKQQSSDFEKKHLGFLEADRLPVFPLPTREEEKQTWEREMTEMWRRGLRHMLTEVIPMLAGALEDTPKSVDWYYRELSRKRKRHEELAPTVSLDDVPGLENLLAREYDFETTVKMVRLLEKVDAQDKRLILGIMQDDTDEKIGKDLGVSKQRAYQRRMGLLSKYSWLEEYLKSTP